MVWYFAFIFIFSDLCRGFPLYPFRILKNVTFQTQQSSEELHINLSALAFFTMEHTDHKHPAFLPQEPENSPWFKPELLPRLNAVREITTWTRPAGTHGCKLTEVVPGVWTAHFDDISEPDIFDRLPISPPIGLVVNSGVAYNQCPTFQGFYGPDVHVLPISLYDDPKEGFDRIDLTTVSAFVKNKVNLIFR